METDTDVIDNLLTEDKLTICCEISIKEDTISMSGQGDLIQVMAPKGSILDDFGKLYDKMENWDVTLVAGGKEIRAHKLVLETRSKVFRPMFEHEMQEQKLSRVDITDIDHEVLTEIVHFMYKDHAPNLDTMAEDLLAAADKYELDNLKVLCEKALCRNLSVETAIITLVLADRHSAERLKQQTIAFINSKHLKMVMATEGWKKMTSTHPDLVAELFSKMAVQMEEHLPNYRFISCETRLRSEAGSPLHKKC